MVHEYLDGVLKAWGQRMEVAEQIDPQSEGCEIASGEGLQDEDVEMMGFDQEEVQEDAFGPGGMWYMNNWVLSSSICQKSSGRPLLQLWAMEKVVKVSIGYRILRQNRNLEIGLVITQVGEFTLKGQANILIV